MQLAAHFVPTDKRMARKRIEEEAKILRGEGAAEDVADVGE